MGALQGKVAFLAGAAGPLGEALSRGLAEEGAVLVSSDEAGSTQDLDKAIKEHGRVDVLVNNFDSRAGKGIAELEEEDWTRALKANLEPVFRFCKAAVPAMKAKGCGRIVNLSNLDYLGWPGKADYVAAKSGLFGLTRSLALELAKDGITVNCLAQGDLETDFQGLSAEDLVKKAGAIPVKRLGRPQDVVRAVVYLASDRAKYVTGQTLFVCGGKSVYCSMSV